jgi:chaperone required for assembly of F1-ATPase
MFFVKELKGLFMVDKKSPLNFAQSGAGMSPEDLARKVAGQALYQRKLPARFYENVEVSEKDAGFALELDAKPVRTPIKNMLNMPTRALAEAVAEEWRAQTDHIDPDTMPLTRLSNTAIDRVAPRRNQIIDEISEYAGSDFLCYRAAEPHELVARYVEHWDPLLAWAAAEIGANFITVTGIVHQQQPDAALSAFRHAAESHDDFVLTGLHNVMTLTGSAVLALALAQERLEPDEAWSLAHVDEDWQIELWGQDEEARERRALRQAEFDATHKFIQFAKR